MQLRIPGDKKIRVYPAKRQFERAALGPGPMDVWRVSYLEMIIIAALACLSTHFDRWTRHWLIISMMKSPSVKNRFSVVIDMPKKLLVFSQRGA